MGKTSIEWAANRDGTPGATYPDWLQRRFWENVAKRESGCWEWTAGRFASSLRYGQFRVGKRKMKAHRVSWEITHGPIPDGLRLLHGCDNPICVNPGHLSLGTDAENIADRGAKGRTRNGSTEHAYLWRGERNPAAKITREVAEAIRASYIPKLVTLKSLGKLHGISQSQVRNIITGHSWRAA